jgi:flagellar assembly protein FliH
VKELGNGKGDEMGTRGWEVAREGEIQIKPMEYAAYDGALNSVRIDSIFSGFVQPEESTGEAEVPVLEDPRIAVLESEMAARLGQARTETESRVAEAYQSGKHDAEALMETKLAAVREGVNKALQSFTEDRDRYFHDVEQQVVRLALSIAAKILHREAQMDPLLLSGAVRVALGQLSETTQVRLRVPSREMALWEEMLRLMPNLPLRPKVIGEENFADGDCVLETEVGSVDLGVRAQLAEIERGFFDLLEQKPVSASPDTASFSPRN